MQKDIAVINELLVDTFNHLLTMEKYILEQSPFNDLTITELHVIEAIGLTPKTMTTVAKRLGITVGSLTATINRTVKKGYVKREQGAEDRRRVHVTLSPKGELAYKVHENFHSNLVDNMVAQLKEIDCTILIESLGRLTQFLREEYLRGETT